MKEHSDGKSFMVGMLMGAAIGLAVGFLYAPKPGSETRAMLKERAGHAKEDARHIIETAREKANTIIATAREEAAGLKTKAQKEGADQA